MGVAKFKRGRSVTIPEKITKILKYVINDIRLKLGKIANVNKSTKTLSMKAVRKVCVTFAYNRPKTCATRKIISIEAVDRTWLRSFKERQYHEVSLKTIDRLPSNGTNLKQ